MATVMPESMKNTYRRVPTLVFGASGFIGRWVAQRLSALSADLHLAVRDPEGMRALMARYGIQARVWPVDVETPGAVARLCNEVQPAIVFNLAGYGVKSHERSEPLADALNRALPIELANACAGVTSPAWAGQALVHAGSALEYGPVDGPVVESLPSTPHTVYGRTKLAGTLGIREASLRSGLRAVVGRIFTVYGAGEDVPRLLPDLIASARGADPLELTEGAQQRDFIYVEDVAEALVRLGANRETEFASVNVATGQLHSVREFVEAAARELEISRSRLRFGVLPYRREEMWHGEVSIKALRARIDWVPTTSLAEGIHAAVGFLSKTD